METIERDSRSDIFDVFPGHPHADHTLTRIDPVCSSYSIDHILIRPAERCHLMMPVNDITDQLPLLLPLEASPQSFLSLSAGGLEISQGVISPQTNVMVDQCSGNYW